MLYQMKQYESWILERLNSEEITQDDILDLIQTHQWHMSFLQHERLLHLLVMIGTGFLALVMFFISALGGFHLVLTLIDVILLGLFIAYLIYFAKLENCLINWYHIANLLESNMDKK